jgi:hypothetical protein
VMPWLTSAASMRTELLPMSIAAYLGTISVIASAAKIRVKV